MCKLVLLPKETSCPYSSPYVLSSLELELVFSSHPVNWSRKCFRLNSQSNLAVWVTVLAQEKKHQDVKGGNGNKQLGLDKAAWFRWDVGIINDCEIMTRSYLQPNRIPNTAMVDLTVLQTGFFRHQNLWMTSDNYFKCKVALHFLCKWIDPQLIEFHRIM